MQATMIFLPAALLALWTLVILTALGLSRVQAVRAGKARPGFYKLYEGESGESDKLKALSRHFSNLLEVPILFYAAVIGAFALGYADPTMVLLAWTFFGLRIVHSAVHLTGNIVPVRFLVFLLGVLTLAGMWGLILTRLLG